MKFLAFLASFLVAASALTRDEIIANREKRVKQLIHQLELMDTTMKVHEAGERVMDDVRLSSYYKRRSVYEEQLAQESVPLTEEDIQAMIDAEEEDL